MFLNPPDIIFHSHLLAQTFKHKQKVGQVRGGFSDGLKSKKYQLNVHITALSLHGENKIISFYISESKFSLS